MRALLALLLLIPALAGADEIRRFALIAGANDGGSSRAQLRYATSDATSVARVLDELGGVSRADQVVVLEPDRAGLQGALAELRARIGASRGGRTEIFVYYSGHSDEEGLLLGEERFGYGELRAALEELPADVRVAILDSCSSGALTRRKGGKRRAPFLVDASTKVKGHAFLTSSSADEAAQESDRIGASFFTHYLVSGLRGAADTTRDGKVTLTEAYQFAFAETLARTEKTASGAQHPAYEMQLVGTGDLVMTDLRGTSAGLVLGQEVSGRVFVRDARGALVVELRKAAAAPVELGLAPGAYRITVDDGGRLSEAEVQLADGKRTTVARSQLRTVAGEATVSRGDAGGERTYRHEPFSFELFPTGDKADVIKGFGLSVLGGRSARLEGAEVSLGVNIQDEQVDGAQFALAMNRSGGPLNGAQLAVGVNTASGPVNGVQGAVLVNHAGGPIDSGAQLSAFANWADGPVEGLQGTSFLNYAGGDLLGAQLSAGGNVLRGSMEGVQAAAGLNWLVGDATGVQTSGGLNVTGGDFVGLQTAPVSWTSGNVSGAQISVLNVGGGNFDGAQIGVINVASGKVDGTQIGVINYAEEVDAPIGIVSVSKKGMFHLDLFASETSPSNLAVKLGGKHVYTVFTGGLGPAGGVNDLRWTAGLGLGGHVPVGSPALSFVNVELVGSSVYYDGQGWDQDDKGSFLGSLRLYGGWELAPRFSIIAGPTLNVLTQVDQSDPDGDTWSPRGGFGIFGESWELHDSENTNVQLWPGFFAGIQI